MKPIKEAMKLAGYGLAAAILAAVAVFFFSLAIFVWAEQHYGTVEAALLLGTLFLAAAVAILGGIAISRRRRPAPPPPPPPARSQWWKDPAVVAAGLELVRIVGVRRIIPAIALGAAIVGAMEKKPARRQSDDDI